MVRSAVSSADFPSVARIPIGEVPLLSAFAMALQIDAGMPFICLMDRKAKARSLRRTLALRWGVDPSLVMIIHQQVLVDDEKDIATMVPLGTGADCKPLELELEEERIGLQITGSSG